MTKTPTKIEVMQEGDERFLLLTFADGSEERKPIVKLLRKPPVNRHRIGTPDRRAKGTPYVDGGACRERARHPIAL
jgi:hypothetical protein